MFENCETCIDLMHVEITGPDSGLYYVKVNGAVDGYGYESRTDAARMFKRITAVCVCGE